ncbi:MAG TPA: glycosyltransferase family A protein, partial [Candidatus Babeliales bacterium]|nr:glycosyltransferase family A protein [Candidatus Babeliales bacterium]
YVDDCSPDGTGKLVEDYVKKNHLENKITLIKNQTREGNPLINHYRAINTCKNNEIVVILDGDDALAHDGVLSYLNSIYANFNIWLTYGQFKNYTNGAIGFCAPMPDFVVKDNTFRYYRDIPSHLRTFYVWLFKAIKHEDLLYNGKFFPMTGDMAAMIPMIEMARDHFKFIPDVLYIYNDVNPLNEHKVSKMLQRQCDLAIRGRKRYEPLKKSTLER